MIRKRIVYHTVLNINNSMEGERIEEKVSRAVNNKEPIEDTAPIIYQERKDGIRPEFDIRTDRFEIAIDAMTAVKRSKVAKRENLQKEDKEVSSGDESIQTTNNE